MMDQVTGRPGELSERLVDLVDRPEPQLRAVATTLLIKALDMPGEELCLMESMVASDDAAVMIDTLAAARARNHLRHRLCLRLDELAADHGESQVVRVMRDHLTAQIERWATRAVDDADNRRRAERFLAWAERPGQLRAAQRRGLFAGMDVTEFRRLADTRLRHRGLTGDRGECVGAGRRVDDGRQPAAWRSRPGGVGRRRVGLLNGLPVRQHAVPCPSGTPAQASAD
jgi:hypothetical protein